MLRLLLPLFFVLLAHCSFSQLSNNWSAMYGGSGLDNDIARAFTYSSDGSLISGGTFVGTVDFDPGPGVYDITGTSTYAPYVTKLDTNGNFVWAKTFNSTWSTTSVADIDTDASGNIYIAGRFAGTVDFDPGPGTHNETVGSASGFLLKLDSNGDFISVMVFESSDNCSFRKVRVKNDKAVIYGEFTGLLDADPGAGTYYLNNPLLNNLSSLLLLQIDLSSGTLSWAHQFGSSIWNDAKDLEISDNNDIYVVGSYSDTIDFNPDPLIDDIHIVNSPLSYVQKFDVNGNYVWGKTPSEYRYYEMEMDAAGDIVLCGLSSTYTDFDDGPGVDIVATNGGQYGFIQKMSVNGDHIWVGAITPSGTVMNGDGLTLDAAGNIYWVTMVNGSSGSVDMDPSSGQQLYTTSANGFDLLATRWDAYGNLVWYQQIAHTLVGGGYNTPDLNLQVEDNDIYVQYPYMGSIDIGLGGTADTLTSTGDYDILIAKINQLPCAELTVETIAHEDIDCANPQGLIEVQAINGTPPFTYAWNTSPVTLSSQLIPITSGIYNVDVFDSQGCARTVDYFVDAPGVILGYDLNVNLVSSGFQAGMPAFMVLDAFNDGCTEMDGEITLVYDASYLSYDSSSVLPSYISGDTLQFDFPLSNYDSTHFVSTLYFTVDSTATLLDSFQIQLQISPISGDSDTTNNVKTYDCYIVTAYDPNDKQAYPTGDCPEHYIKQSEDITYTVRFQNTGNANAVDVYIMDSIDYALDLSSLHVIGQSHPNLEVDILSENVVRFRFDSIMLPPESTGGVLSNGYVIFNIEQKANLPNGTLIDNRAGIYFDFNPPIITNTVFHTVSSFWTPCTTLGMEDGEALLPESFVVFPNPVINTLHFKTGTPDSDYTIVAPDGKVMQQGSVNNAETIDVSALQPGLYILVIESGKNRYCSRFIKQ